MSRLVERLRDFLARDKSSNASADPKLIAEFNAALADDLDTPRALRSMRAALRQRDAAAVRWMLGMLVGTASLT
jgi:cysteinyl-tRNA synthetase